MKVHLIREESIWEFVSGNASSKVVFDKFLIKLQIADWNIPADIKNTFSYSDVICEGERVVFNIGGNGFRMICGIKFRTKVVILYVKFIGTHADYTKLCNAKRNEVGVCNVDKYKS